MIDRWSTGSTEFLHFPLATIFILSLKIGNFTVDTRSSPMLFDIIVQAGKMVNISIVSIDILIEILGS